ncbi:MULTISPECIES: metallophosphoesterase [unclassified Treponema]|uniref:metallophosphoesterase n=1 Tax=unclassified Treponema TaxID=2638727 RepID=UPI0020A3D392|nr:MULTISPECIES: metallophosphoesterase [unclassified Treponema]UTC68072.1 metallophosphoesterase [Treponema sp. OMZ 789]UTC70794.1 metallophosphoesterase [Treponema sp. OMZ 790]UTC73534.1 metallophosphoesterase [Treponema sp. OMZ 791]
MNSLEHFDKGIFASPETLKKLKYADSARLILISDTHGNADTIINILCREGKKSDAVLFSGDGLADFLNYITISQYEKELMECMPPVAALVMGNCDSKKYVLNLDAGKTGFGFKKNPEQLLEFFEIIFLEVCGKKILLTHGHEFYVDFELNTLSNFAVKHSCQVCIFGHTHVPMIKEVNGMFFINPGSASRPRMSSNKSYGILTMSKNANPSVEFINL